MKKILKLVLFSFVLFVTSTGYVFAEDRVHVITLEQGSADAIILESNGRFAMIDTGEDKDYPDGSDINYPARYGITTDPKNSTEDRLFSHLNKLGVKKLDFIIVTHAHSDHIGTAGKLMKKIPTEKLYLKKYSDERITDKNRLWDNKYGYDKALKSAKENRVEIIQDITPELAKIKFGNMDIELLNYENEYENGELKKVYDDNLNSILSVINVNGQRLFFGGDLENTGDRREDKYAPLIGKVDCMKFNHHADCGNSNSKNFIVTLSPKKMIKTAMYDLYNFDRDYKEWFDHMGIEIIDAGRIDQEAITLDITKDGINDISSQFRKYGIYQENGVLKFKKWDGSFPEKGWFKNAGKWYYSENNELVKNKWKDDCYLKADGEMAISKWILDKEHNTWYYMKSNGRRAKEEWQGNYYLKADGKMATLEWVYDRTYGAWYYLKKDGTYTKEEWQGNYYLKADGSMAKSEWIFDKDFNAWYYLKADGNYAIDTTTPDGYKVDASGKLVD